MEPGVNVPLVVVPAMKLVPVTVTVVSPAPALTVAGLSVVMAGALTVKVLAAETWAVEPPLRTVRLTVPAEAMAAAGTVTEMEVAVPAVAVKAVVLVPT